MRYIIKIITRMVPMPTPKILIVVSSLPLICYGRELISFRSTRRDATGDGCGCYAWSTDPRSGSDYRVVMLLTLADYLSILRANYGQWIIFYIKAVLLVS
jgi:hypothetical protein